MEQSRYIDLKKLSLDELTGVINLYPWFGSARKELCERMLALGGSEWGEEQFSDAAMYVPSRRIISDMVHAARKVDCSDKDVSSVLKMYISEGRDNAETAGNPGLPPADAGFSQRQVRVVGGDYFSQKEYDRVRKDDDGIFSRFAVMARQEMTPDELQAYKEMDFCTETLAQIYAEQGYYEHAKHIYKKLILAYPEKNAYFAALIEKLNPEN